MEHLVVADLVEVARDEGVVGEDAVEAVEHDGRPQLDGLGVHHEHQDPCRLVDEAHVVGVGGQQPDRVLGDGVLLEAEVLDDQREVVAVLGLVTGLAHDVLAGVAVGVDALGQVGEQGAAAHLGEADAVQERLPARGVEAVPTLDHVVGADAGLLVGDMGLQGVGSHLHLRGRTSTHN